jgi:hypothetical protein
VRGLLRRWADWFADVFLGGRPHRAIRVEDDPLQAAPRTVYLIGDGDAPWAAAMRCPCGCGAIIRLSLIPLDSPSWSVEIYADGVVTLRPSVWRTKGCRSHFVLWRGRVIWAKDLGRQHVAIDFRRNS